jgi:thiosulfate reductase/polysulfide reductase chain A
MCVESIADPGRIAGINQRCKPGSVRFFSIFFMQHWGKVVKVTGDPDHPITRGAIQRQIEKARQKVPDPLVTIHPMTAEKLGLSTGDWAVISTPLGSIRQRVRLSDAIHPQMADLQHSWWFPERDPNLPELFGVFESNTNVLCPDAPEFCSPEIGSWPHTALLCRIEKETA